ASRFEILEGAIEAVAERVLDRPGVPANALRSGCRDERQDELLAGRVQLARGPVQAAEREALDLAVETAPREGRLRRARVGEPRLSEPDCPEGELHDQERGRPGDQCQQQSQPHRAPRSRSAGTTDSAAKSAAS